MNREEYAERANAVRRYTQAGYSADYIADRLGCDPRTVVRHRRALGLSKPAPPRITEQQLAQALPLLQDGAGYAETARTIGCKSDALARHLPGYGLTKAEAGARGQLNRYINRIGAAA